MLGAFTCAAYRFVLEARTPLRLNAFAGSTLRGGFGHVFKRTVCIWPPGDCPRCLLKNTCSYPYVFETAPTLGAQKLRNLDQIPRPFIIEPPSAAARLFQPGDRFDFRLVLVGRAIDHLPYFVFTFQQLGQVGLGPIRGQFELMELHADTPAGSECLYTAGGPLRPHSPRVTAADLAPPAATDGTPRLAIHFMTPTRIRNDGTVQTDLTFQDVIRALLRRLSSLCYFHCDAELAVDFRGLIDQAAAVQRVESRLRWRPLERFSGRQSRRIEMGGVEGTVVFEAPDPRVWRGYLPLLRAGEWVHVGKGAVMGLGRYRVEGQA